MQAIREDGLRFIPVRKTENAISILTMEVYHDQLAEERDFL